MDEIPNEVYENISLLDKKYTKEDFVKSVVNGYETFFNKRKDEFEQVLTLFKNKENEE
jgi:hypothetical protein